MAKQPVFGDILLAARRAQRLTQQDLANRSGVAVRAISGMERGQVNPNLRSIMLLTAGLGAQLVLGFKIERDGDVVVAVDQDRRQSKPA